MTIKPLDINILLNDLVLSLQAEIQQNYIKNPLVIGIHTGGVWVAEHIHQALGIKEPLAQIDISFYRDDFSQIGVHPKVKPNTLPLTVEGRNIILIDDVFYTGRTVRAALNEIFDYGRPERVILGVLVERNGRQIPMRPDCIGVHKNLPAGHRIELLGPKPLEVMIKAL